ncbi:MAG: glutamate--cysteine ligase [Pseudomonadota bacterium]
MTDNAPITDQRDMVAYLQGGSKPPTDWRIGTEHEKFAFDKRTLRPLGYHGERGIAKILDEMQRFGWQAQREEGNIIALVNESGASISLEPGGQLELSGAPLASVHETCAEVRTHLAHMREVCEVLGVGLLGAGHLPRWSLEDIEWIPKARYGLMRRYMPERGGHGLEMMKRTCTVQVNLDFADEADMVRKMRVGLALQPIATALFANSPFKEGAPAGYASYRSHLWQDVDPDRTGGLDLAFEPGFGFERYVDYALDVPMYFVYRDGRYIDALGQSFRDFMAARLPALPGEVPTIRDFADHLTVVFTDVRLKRFIEMRGADSGPWRVLCALPAFWVGLLYDEQALSAATDLTKAWTADQRQELRSQASLAGLAGRFAGKPLADLARQVLAIAQQGLGRRAQTLGESEAAFLAPLHERAQEGKSPADLLLAAYHTTWDGSVDPIYRTQAY